MSSYKCLQKITSHDVTEQAQLHGFLSIWELPAYVNNKFGGSSPTGPVGLIRSNPESGGPQAHGKGCEGFGKVID